MVPLARARRRLDGDGGPGAVRPGLVGEGAEVAGVVTGGREGEGVVSRGRGKIRVGKKMGREEKEWGGVCIGVDGRKGEGGKCEAEWKGWGRGICGMCSKER